MRVLGLYLAGHYRRHYSPELRRFLLAAGVVAAVYFLVALWPAFEAGHRSTYARATYDLMVNGPLQRPDLEAIRGVLPDTNRVEVRLNIGASDRIENTRTKRVTSGNVYRYEPDEQRLLPRTYFNDGVRLAGEMSVPGAWGIDANTARRVGARIGDEVRFVQVFTLGDESRREVSRSGRIAAIYQPSTVLQGLLVPFEPADREIFTSIGADYTHVFYQVTGEPEGLANAIRRLPPAQNWMVATANRQRRQAETAIAIGAGQTRSLTQGVLAVGAIAYLGYSLLEEQRRFRVRRRAMAIFTSLGCRRGTLLLALALEQAVFVAASFAVGLWLGTALFWQVLKSYVPPSVNQMAIVAAIVTYAVIASLTSLASARNAARLPVAQLLSAE